MNKIKNFIIGFLILFFSWFLWNNTLDVTVILIGVGLSAAVSLFYCRKCDLFTEIKLSPKAIIYTFIYVFVFLWELLKSNLDIARIVLTPSLPINPGIIEAKTKLKSKMGRLILANSITLTPGTFTIDIIEDTFYIHCVDVTCEEGIEVAAKNIITKFEKYLEVMYG